MNDNWLQIVNAIFDRDLKGDFNRVEQFLFGQSGSIEVKAIQS